MSGYSGHRRPILPPSARRLRHVQCVFARQLRASAGGLPTAYFRLCRAPDPGGGEGELVYQSEAVDKTLNPVWKPLPVAVVRDVADTHFVVTVVEEGTGVELARAYIELRRAVCLCPRVTDLRPVASATLLFECQDGVFAPASPAAPHALLPPPRPPAPPAALPQLEEMLRDCGAAPGGMEADAAELEQCGASDVAAPQRLCDIQLNVLRVVSLAYAVESAQGRAAELRAGIERRLAEIQRRRRLELDREYYRHRTAELRAEVAAAEARVAARREAAARRREQLRERREEVRAAAGAVAAKRRRHAALQQRRQRLQRHIAQVERAAALRRQQLVDGLADIYPIKVDNAQQVLTISGMHLPSSDSMATDETAATALGYVAHCVQLLSRVWGIPVRYAVYPIASRSYIKEQHMEPKTPATLQLFYIRGYTKQQYFEAIYLLNKNLRQLLKVRGVGVVDPKRMLMNLQYLLQSDHDREDADSGDGGAADDELDAVVVGADESATPRSGDRSDDDEMGS